jgi:predicted Zn-dependent protease
MRFSREFERQADIEGAQIMARAGYDPRDMAAMFRIIAQRSGAGGPEWLSDHPNPGNRSDYITREARLLRVSNPAAIQRSSASFAPASASCRRRRRRDRSRSAER